MDQNLKEDWVKALRSGEYKQGEDLLYRSETDSYCCLGVLCKVAGKDLYAENIPPQGYGYGWLDTILPTGVGIFTEMNDIQGKSFNEIADYIEANL
jgi:hypothetical protein